MSIINHKPQNWKKRGRHKSQLPEEPFDENVRDEPIVLDKLPDTNRQKHRSIISSKFVTNGGIFTFCLLIVVFFLYDGILATKQSLNIEALTKDLQSSVEGQQEAINLVLEGVRKMYSLENKLNIISFFGSTGVGKTHIAQIVKSHFSLSTYEIQGPLDYFNINKFIDHIRGNDYRFNLIIIDDLTLTDVDILLKLLKAIPTDLGAVVICIFNIQETDNRLNYSINYKRIDETLDKFQKAYIFTKVAKFHQIDERLADHWIRKQLNGKEFNDTVISNVLSEQNLKYHGFKGLSTKLNLIRL